MGKRIEEEKRVVARMIGLYCHGKEGHAELCADCRELLEYAYARLERCPFGEEKGTCRLCTVHCYRAARRERMRQVMRYAGPRMLLYHPWMALRHLYREYGKFSYLCGQRKRG